jgi:DNA polymerase-1
VSGPLDNVKLYWVESFDDIRKFMEWMESVEHLPISVDTESTGLKWHGRDYVRMIQLGDEDFGWAMRYDRFSGLAEAALKLHTGPIDLANAKFDYAFLRKAGIILDQSRIRGVDLMAHVNESHMSRALKVQSKRHVDSRSNALQQELDEALSSRSEWTWETIPFEFAPYHMYAALDPVLTAHVRKHHWPIVQERSSYAFEVENSFQWVALKAETRGVHIDVEYAKTNYDKFTQYCHDVEKWCLQEYGIKPGSNREVINKLQSAGFDFTKVTEKGALSLDQSVLEIIDHPLANAVLSRRQLQKISSTYLRFYIENVDGDSLIHPSINTVGARTSRMSMSEPNFQNVPVRGGGNGIKVVRNCITSRPGHTLVMVDLAQIEMRGLAIYSGDPGLIQAFSVEEDFFVTIAREIFDDPKIDKDDPRRSPTKNNMYARMYGAGLAKQAATAGVTIEQMRFVSRSLDARYPGIEVFARQLINNAIAAGRAEGCAAYVVCPLTGQRLYADPGKEYALVNYYIQGWAAKLFKIKMLELDAAGLGDYIIMFVHDEVILDVPNYMVRDAIYTIQKIMNDSTMFPVAISSSVSTGKRWGEKKEWSEE